MSASTSTPVVAIEGLQIDIGRSKLPPLVKDISFTVPKGRTLGIVGESGSGKTLTSLAFMGLLQAPLQVTRGSMRLSGQELVGLPDERMRALRGNRMAMVFQEPMTALNPLMRVVDQVAETVTLHGADGVRAARDRARQALDAVGLGDGELLKRYPHELSGGQRQRVAIAAATVLSPAVLIADEPTTALDAGTQAGVLKLLVGLARERNVGILMVSHDLAVISSITDRIVVMREGAIVERMATADLPRGAHHPYTRSLFAAAELGLRAADPAPGDGNAPEAAPGPPDQTRVLSAHGLVREYPSRRRSFGRRPPSVRAVDDVSLHVHAGETVGLVGESGSGKSTLLRALWALDRPLGGEVRLLGDVFAAASGASRTTVRRLRRSIQVVPQDPVGSFDPLWTVERLVAEPYHALDALPTRAEMKRNVAEVLEQVGLGASDAARYPHEFSGGQRQRIAIARALILRPAVIAFDEAVSALDVVVRAQILGLLAELKARLRLAYLFVSHDLNVVRAIADRVYVMQLGRVVEEGPTEGVLGSPKHVYTRALVAATPRFGVRIR
jgi:peptide/nickel transport system ATP-binding protein